MQMVEEGHKIRYEITTGLFYWREHHILGPCARLLPYLEDYFTDATGDSAVVSVVFLMHHVDLLVEYLVASGFFLGVLEFFRPLLCELSFWFEHSGSFGSTSTCSTLFDPI
jgi:hypothetical protein